MGLWQRLTAGPARLMRSREASAAVEFALILPIMLLAYIGTMEASALISTDRRVQTIAGSVGDLVSRSKDSITWAELDDYFQASQAIMAPYPTTGMVQRVTSVFVDTAGVAKVEWSKDQKAATPYAKGAIYVLPSEITSISKNSYLIVSEAAIGYTPLLGIVFQQSIPLYRENFYVPRFGDPIVYK